jgi:dienelactone hydrolase
MRQWLLVVIACTFVPAPVIAADDPTRVFDKPVVDARMELIRSLHEGSGFKPYADKAAWDQRAQYLRQQVLIAAGLWPMPDKCPLNPVIHGKIDRDGYSVEKVYFQSYPGFYVTGNLYRPTGRKGPFPAVLSPHGHWNNGRLYEATDKEAAAQIKGGWEKDEAAAKFPLQARAANLAKLGCVVFFYDMVGYADADEQHFPHHKTYTDIDSDLHGLSVFGLQLWDGIRAVDFVQSLPDVDKTRIACTGASGGGTQTFTLMAVEDRLTAAAPVCMISAGEHQGGCVCENNSLLRIGTDNVELAATFAPRPFIHPTCTGDWTKDFLEQGFPEIQATYRLFGAEGNIESYRQTAQHNYNLHSREWVYNFFNKQLKLGVEGTIAEQKFEPIKPKDLSVWDGEHQRPKEAVDAEGLKKYLIEIAAKQIEALKPTDAASLQHFREVMRPALEHMAATSLPQAAPKHEVLERGQPDAKGISAFKVTLQREGDPQAIPAIVYAPAEYSGVTVLVLPEGKKSAVNEDGSPRELLAALLAAHQAVMVPDVFGVGELKEAAEPKSVEFFAGYNRTTLTNRVHDVLTAVKSGPPGKPVNLVGVGEAGGWCLLARALAGDAIEHAVIDASACDLGSVHSDKDANYLPHALRYGGMWPLAALGAPAKLLLHHVPGDEAPVWLKAAYTAAGSARNLRVERELSTAQIVKALNE